MDKNILKRLIKEIWDKSKLNEEGAQETKIMLGGKPYKLVLDVNKNPTKKGIKVQFLPLEGDPDPNTTAQKDLQIKILDQLNKGIKQYGLEGDIDPDVPDKRVIGFYIRLQYFDKIIRNALRGGNDEKETSPSPEEATDSIEDQQ